LHISPPHIILIFGFVSLAITVYIVTVVDDFLIRFVLWMVTHTIFRIRIVGQENVPFRGPGAAGVESHVARGRLSGGRLRAALHPLHGVEALLRVEGAELVLPQDQGDSGGRRARCGASDSAPRARNWPPGTWCASSRRAPSAAPGTSCRSSAAWRRSWMALDVPIIPVHLDRLWGSIFSFERGRFFWKWPKRIPYPVTVSFGNPMPANSTAHAVRQAIQELAAEATAHRQTAGDTLPRRLIRSARRNWSHFAMADSTGRELTYGRMLTGGLLVANWARTRRDEEMIGVLLPPSVAGALVNVGSRWRAAFR
jgi:acyl-[acyl-carrier-protein]-phospholipid O-acyltransferase/long-chain-fatty-acid--[acyl-carrier-protein] ligase